jgi:hypothetical protein
MTHQQVGFCMLMQQLLFAVLHWRVRKQLVHTH